MMVYGGAYMQANEDHTFKSTRISACLDDAGMQVQVVGHDCGAQYADGSKKDLVVGYDFPLRNKPFGYISPIRLGGAQLVCKTACDDLHRSTSSCW